MSDIDTLVQRYIDTWNETDGRRRRDLIGRTWTDTARYVDPMMSGDGPNGIDAMIAGVQQRFPGHKIRLAGKIDAHNDCARFNWELAGPDGQALVAGIDFAVVAGDQRLQSVTGFIDRMPQP